MATLQSGKCFTVPTFFGMCCRSEWQEIMYIYKWHEVDQTKHEIFCVHIVCNEIQVKVNLEITTFFFYLRFPYCPNFFWFGVVQNLENPYVLGLFFSDLWESSVLLACKNTSWMAQFFLWKPSVPMKGCWMIWCLGNSYQGAIKCHTGAKHRNKDSRHDQNHESLVKIRICSFQRTQIYLNTFNTYSMCTIYNSLSIYLLIFTYLSYMIWRNMSEVL